MPIALSEKATQKKAAALPIEMTAPPTGIT
jgi:hypothetical protein